MWPRMIAGITVRKRPPNPDKIDKMRLQIASGSVRDADGGGAGCAGKGRAVSSGIAPF